MRKFFMSIVIASMTVWGVGCDEEDMEAAGDSLKEAASKVGDSIEDTASGLGNQMEQGKERIRDAADDIENE